MAGIRGELAPAALVLGWVPRERQPRRKGERRCGEFEFERVGPNRIEHMGFDFQYLDIPTFAALQGRGLAGELVRGVLDQARTLGWRVRPVCSYVAAYMRRHPETQDLLEPA